MDRTIKSIHNNGQQLIITESERDLRVIYSNNLKWRTQVITCVSKANQMMGRIKKCFIRLDLKLLRSLYVCCSSLVANAQRWYWYVTKSWLPSYQTDSIIEKTKLWKVSKSYRSDHFSRKKTKRKYDSNFLNLQWYRQNGNRRLQNQMRR